MKQAKRFLALVLSLVCAVSLLAVFTVSSCADYDSYWGGAMESGSPGSQDFHLGENSGVIDHPKSSEYLDDYQIRYVHSPKDHSVFIFNKPSGSAKHPYVVYHGQQVLRLAKKRSGWSCVLYYDKHNDLRVGWINSSHLVTDFPGRTASTGFSRQISSDNTGPWSVRWKTSFPGTDQPYAKLDTPIYDCVGFTLDYFVTDRNGTSSENVTGERTIYVDDGSGWSEVGTFRYDKIEPVHIQVTLSSPMTVKAIGVSADCYKPNKFDFRMAVLDVLAAD